MVDEYSPPAPVPEILGKGDRPWASNNPAERERRSVALETRTHHRSALPTHTGL